MSYEDDIEESLGSFFDMMETCENDSLRTSTPTRSDVEGTDDTASTPDAVDPNKAFDEPSPPIKKPHTTVQIGQDFSGNPCEISCSETSGTGTSDSVGELLPWRRRRPGISGFIASLPFNMQTARNRGYLFPFELVCLGFTILCCFTGAQSWIKCPANPYIPRYVFVNGAIGTFSASVQVMDSLWKFFFRRRGGMWKYFCAFGIGWVAVITTLIEMTEFYTMSYSFDWKERNYCNERFYWFVYYKNIAFGVLMSLAALIYIPSFKCRYYYGEYFYLES